jgi:hypothetical protein
MQPDPPPDASPADHDDAGTSTEEILKCLLVDDAEVSLAGPVATLLH